MSVSTPSLPPLLCMKSGKTYSLYTYKNGWNAKLGRSYRIPGSTKAVGKIKEGTSTEEAPWIIVEGNSKYYARIKVLKTVVKALEEKIKEVEKADK